MSLPSFLGPFAPVPAPHGHGHALSPIGGGAAHSLSFKMQTQTQTEWCWAATSASIDDFYLRAGGKSQCQVATGLLGGNCCTTPGSSTCNQPYYLDLALTWVGHLAQPCILNAIPLASNGGAAPSVEDEIDAGRPIGCHISWSGGGGHFNAIHGYDRNTQDVDVADPFYSTHTLPYSVFQTKYQSTGTWDASYLTK